MKTSLQYFLSTAAVCLWLHGMASLLPADVMPGQIDDFEDGTTLGWQHGMPNPDEPRVVTAGGPGGSGDAFVEVSSHGGFGPGSKLIMYNKHERWTGSYLREDLQDPVVGLEVDFANFGQEPLTMWFSLDGTYEDDEGDPVFASVFTDRFEVTPGGAWQHASFSLLPEDLTSNGDPLKVLDNVTTMWLFHNAVAPSHPAPSVEAVLGMDNLTAIGGAVEPLPGDYNGNGLVEQADLDLVLTNWGVDGTTPPTGWTQDLPQGFIDQAELDRVLSNWGKSSAALNGSAVPEPAAWLLLALLVGMRPWRIARA